MMFDRDKLYEIISEYYNTHTFDDMNKLTDYIVEQYEDKGNVSAEQMFKELGYKKTMNKDYCNGVHAIIYQKFDEENKQSYQIEFYFINKEVLYCATREWWDEETNHLYRTGTLLEINEFKAIVQQMRELGVDL